VGRTSLDLSSEGRFLAYTTHNYLQQFQENTGRSDNHVPRVLVGCTAHVLDIEQGTDRALRETGTSWGGCWSPDGQRLAFFFDSTGEPHLCIWHRDADPIPIFSEAIVYVFFEFETVRWSPDGNRIFFKVLPVQQQTASPAPPAQPEGAASVQLWESAAVRKRRDPTAEPLQVPASGSSARDGLTDLAMADLRTGLVDRIQTGTSIRSFEVSPDGRQLAIVGNIRFEDLSRIQPIFDLYLVPIPSDPLLPSQDVQTPIHPPFMTGLSLGYGLPIAWSPDGASLAYTTDDSESMEKADVVVIDVRNGMSRTLTQEAANSPSGKPRRIEVGGTPLPNFHSEYDPPRWTPDSRHLLCVAEGTVWRFSLDGNPPHNLTQGFGLQARIIVGPNVGSTASTIDSVEAIVVHACDPALGKFGFYRIPLSGGDASPLLEVVDHLVRADRFRLDVAEETGACVFRMEDAATPPDIYLFDPATHTMRQVTSINPPLRDVRFSQPQRREWRLDDDRTGQGILLLPPTATPEAKAPLIVWGYPGNTVSGWIHHFNRGQDSVVSNLEYFVARGYGVLWPNISLVGNEPLQEITQAILPGLDAAIATRLVDGDRIGVIGHSYEGYMVNCLITQTQRFKAAVSSAPIGNLVSFYLGGGEPDGTGWTGWAAAGQGRMGGSLWEQQDRYIRNSPVFYLDQVETPLLLIAGEADQGCLRQAIEMFCGLRRLDKEVVLARYKDGVHHWATWSPQQIEDFWERVLSWFDIHLNSLNHL
jgi:Tol biopolymer transport system component/dienelactone hydrolase